MYNWQHKNWANFTYNPLSIKDIVIAFEMEQKEMEKEMVGLDAVEQQEERIRFMIAEAQKTSEIEGEYISRIDLMSSIKNKLNPNEKAKVTDERANSMSNLLFAVESSYEDPLSLKMIKDWHGLLFANSRIVNAGKWRKGEDAMQIVSGVIGKEIVHFEAPPSFRVDAEMKQFVKWYNSFSVSNVNEALIKTAISHLYFESIHPFEDGNGRIGRAIAEKCLVQSLGKKVILSLSLVIEKNRKHYYDAFKVAQSTMEVTDWIVYFANTILLAQSEAVGIVRFSLLKAKFFDQLDLDLNQRQQKAINKMFDAGVDGFVGGMTAKKYISITKTTKATATRDLQELVKHNVLIQKGGGRSIHYDLNLPATT